MEQKNKSVDELMLDSEMSRYELVKLVSMRFNQIKKNSENSKNTISQLIEKSMSDIVSGEISKEEIQKQAMSSEIPEELSKEQGAKRSSKALEAPLITGLTSRGGARSLGQDAKPETKEKKKTTSKKK